MKNMKNMKITISRLAVLIVVAFGFWIGFLTAYEIIANPDTFTWYEMFMSSVVGCFVSDRICGWAFQRKDGASDA